MITNLEIINTTEPNTSALEIGATIKNYKALCQLLGEEPKTSDSKKAQLKNWSRYFEFEKIKNKQSYIILDIYDEPLEKEDNRNKGNNSVYSKYIETILINYLSNIEDNTKTLTRHAWWELLGMANQNFSELKDHPDRNTYTIIYIKLYKILNTALENLRARNIISYEEQIFLEQPDHTFVLATEDMYQTINNIEQIILLDVFKYKSIYRIYCKRLEDKFYDLVDKILYATYGYISYYRTIHINLINKPEFLSSQYDEIKLNLNKLIQKYFYTHINDPGLIQKYISIE